MKSKIISTISLFAVAAVLLTFMSSCSKKDGSSTSEQKGDKNVEVSSIDDKDLAESDEDLTTVDYKEFYDQLSPNGEWVQVKPEEIGLQPKTASSKGHNGSFSVLDLLGIIDANASE